ncbi:MAG: tetratricopeptide repeat protein [Chitinophagales bacterium]
MKKKQNKKREIEEDDEFFDFEDEFEDEFEDDDAPKEKKGGFFSKLFGGDDEDEFEDEFDDEFEEEKPVVKHKKTTTPPPPKKKLRKPIVEEDEFEDEFEEEEPVVKRKTTTPPPPKKKVEEDEFEDEFEEEEIEPVVRRKKTTAPPPPKKKVRQKVVEENEFDEYDDEYDDDEIALDPQQKKIALGVLGILALLFLAWIMWPSGKTSKQNASKNNANVSAAASLDNLPEPNTAKGFADRAQAYFNIQAYDKSLEYLNKAIAQDPNYVDIHRNKGMLFSLTNRHDLAIPEFDLHLQSKPDDAIVYHWRGIAKFNAGQYAEAIADFSEVINRDEPKGEYFVYRSQAHNALGNKKEALADAQQAQKMGIELKPEYLQELQGN